MLVRVLLFLQNKYNGICLKLYTVLKQFYCFVTRGMLLLRFQHQHSFMYCVLTQWKIKIDWSHSVYGMQVSHYVLCIQLQYIQYWLSPWFCGRLFFGAWKFPCQN